MSSNTLDWGTQALWESLRPLLPGLSIEIVERIASTNGELMDRLRGAAQATRGRGVRAADVQPELLVAVHQTHGKGRMGRAWESLPGASLTFSLALPIAREDWSGLSLAVGVAIANALDSTQARVRVKWPNDLWLANDEGVQRKLGGILIESASVGSQRMAIIGVGLNVLPQQLVDGTAVASVSELGPWVTPPAVLALVAKPLILAVHTFSQEGFAPFAAGFAERDLLNGQQVQTTHELASVGEAMGVDADGALRVRSGGTVHRLISGEVSVRPQWAADGVG